MGQLKDYIVANRVSKKRLSAEIEDERNQKLPQRNAFVLLKKYTKDFFTHGAQPRMIALSGLRGVGKTTLMWQTANYVFNNHTKEIYFISVDDLNRLNSSLFDVINVLEKEIFGCTLNELTERILLMIDEVHEAREWQRDLKILYERGKKIFILTTGSSALLLHESPDLASRWTLMKIFPFKFSEFILAKSWLENTKSIIFPVKGLASILKTAFFYSVDYSEVKEILESKTKEITSYLTKSAGIIGKDINSLIDEYVSFHNIARFLPIRNKTIIMDRILALFDRIMLKDIPEMNMEVYNVFNRLLFRLALSDEINYESLAGDFNISQKKVEKFIGILNNAEILNVFLPHGGARSRTGKTKKAFFMSPSLRRALFSRIYGEKFDTTLKAKLYEDILAMYLKNILPEGVATFGYGKTKNTDFIIETNTKPMLLEIGINKKNISQIKSFGNYRYGLIINSKITGLKFDERNKIIFVPLSWILLI